MQKIKEKIISLISIASNIKPDSIPEPSPPPNEDMGDWSVKCFPLAQKLNKIPDIIATELRNNIPSDPLISHVETIGPYLNFYLDWKQASGMILSEINQKIEEDFKSFEGNGKTVVIDLSSPNIAKPFGIGHLRSTNIGSVIGRLFELKGYRIIRINHLGDWGTQFGKLIAAFKHWGDEAKLYENPIRYLYDLYVRFHAEEEKNPGLEDEGRQWFKKLEDDDPEAVELWNHFRELSLEEFKTIYNMLGVTFESYTGESFYNSMLKDLIKELIEKGIAVESVGALIVDLSKYDMPPCLLRKKDGATLYATRDICAAQYRFNKYKFDHMLYVVGAPQALHFKQVFKVLELMGHEWAAACEHIPFGHIRFKDDSMSTRKGNIIFIDEVLNKATTLIEEIIKKKNPDLKNIKDTASKVGVGAILFGDLKTRRHKEVIFDWDEILNPNGETGPYVQYTYARFCSILRKAGEEVSDEVESSLLIQPEEIGTLKCLGDFAESIDRAIESREPQVITDYLISLCAAANRFHKKCRVLVEDNNLRRARLSLVYTVKEVLAKGLAIIGIAAPEEM